LLNKALADNEPQVGMLGNAFKDLSSSVSDSIKELINVVPVNQLAYMLPKCRSSFLTKEDRKELLEALKNHI
jgi:hypothetical protein